MKKLFENVSGNQFKLITENIELSRSAVINIIKQFPTHLYRDVMANDNNGHIKLLADWILKEGKFLTDSLDKAEKRNEVDKYLPAFAKRLVIDYDYIVKVLDGIKQNPDQIQFLVWMKKFVDNWRNLPK